MTEQGFRADRTFGLAHRPFDKVPAEILGHILGLVFKSYPDRVSRERYRLPSVLCKVSRFFNRITLSTPLLWSYLHITDETNLAHTRQRIEHRSGILPIDIYVGVREHDWLESSVNPLLDTCSERWRNLYVNLLEVRNESPEPYWAPFTWLLQRPAPQLQSLFLENKEIYVQRLPGLLLPAIFTPVPQLKILWLDGCSLSWWRAFPPTLETLHVRERFSEGLQAPEIVACLQGPLCQSLRSLTLDGVIVNYFRIPIANGAPVFPESATLERLEFFEVRYLDTLGTMTLFNLIKTPNLRHLSLQIDSEDVAYLPRFEPLLREWKSLQFPTLEELSLGWMGCPEDTVVDFISNLPDSMVHLNIARELEGTVDRVLGALESPRTEEFCSRLKHLRVAGLHLWEVVSLVRSRLVNLELLELDTRDTLMEYGGKGMETQEEIDTYLDVLGSLVPKLNVVWTRDHYSSALSRSFTTGSWKSDTKRRKKE